MCEAQRAAPPSAHEQNPTTCLHVLNADVTPTRIQSERNIPRIDPKDLLVSFCRGASWALPLCTHPNTYPCLPTPTQRERYDFGDDAQFRAIPGLFVRLHTDHAKTWVYPEGKEIRTYQVNIVSRIYIIYIGMGGCCHSPT